MPSHLIGSSQQLRWFLSSASVGLALLVLQWPSYYAGTALWIACAALLVLSWPRAETSPPTALGSASLSLAVRILIAAGCAWTLYLVAVQLLPQVFAGPPDSGRGDMLPAINLAVDQFLNGGNPYRFYQVPWEVPLNYGPVLWGPYILPHLLQFDVRVWTLAAQLTIPAACALAAIVDARRSHFLRAAVLTALAVALAFQPQYLEFFPIGHTQVYWPLILVFAILVAQERWTACCVTVGLLVAARTTMVAIVPVLLIALWVRGELTWRRVVLIAIFAIGPFVPFLLTAPKMVFYGLYGVYIKVVKGYVWKQTVWAVTTYGFTRALLRNNLERYLEVVQALVMLTTYGAAYFGLRARQSPLPWMVLALLMFCMTAVWPVVYIYLDVWILAIAGLAGASLARVTRSAFRAFLTPAALYVVVFAIVLAAGAHVRGASFTIDVGTPASTGMTGGGFGTDKSESEGDRNFVWVDGTAARVRLPRAGVFGGAVHVTLKPFAPVPGLKQTVTALLNDRAIGSVTLTDGWQDISFDAGRSSWTYGFNLLTLQFSYAVSAAQSGTGTDTKEYSVAIDRVSVGPR